MVNTTAVDNDLWNVGQMFVLYVINDPFEVVDFSECQKAGFVWPSDFYLTGNHSLSAGYYYKEVLLQRRFAKSSMGTPSYCTFRYT